jgi:hypothetical protein
LETLRVDRCAVMPTSELHRLRALPALTTLEISKCFTLPLDAFTLDAFNPDSDGFMSDRLPQLRTVKFE